MDYTAQSGTIVVSNTFDLDKRDEFQIYDDNYCYGRTPTDFILTFPETFMKEQDWCVGDTLEWITTNGGIAIVNKSLHERQDLSSTKD